MTDIGAENLIQGIVMQAVKDYRCALYNYNTAKGRGKKQEYRHRILECERFFLRDMKNISDLDGAVVIRITQDKVRESLKKKGIAMEVPRNDSRGSV